MAQPDRGALDRLRDDIVVCRRCPRLVAWREEAAAHPPARFAGEPYWARPVPGFGDPRARVYVLGLATAAHGGNRTGRAFTGNPTADWLVASMHRAGLANQPVSTGAGDGLRLSGAWMASAVRCPPPANRPTPGERDACATYLDRELAALPDLRVVVALGGLAWNLISSRLEIRPRPRFGHEARVVAPNGLRVLGSYHPSRQNTATGVLTRTMLDSVFRTAVTLAFDS